MVHTSRTIAGLAGALALGTALIAGAADAPPAPKLVSGASAAMLAETCAGCHGTDGLSVGPASPTLAGSNPEYFVEVMQGFQDGKVYSTIMGRIAKGYTAEEIQLMAEYFEAKPFKAAAQEFDAALVKKGTKLHDKYCEKCHSEGGKALTAEVLARAKDEGEGEADAEAAANEEGDDEEEAEAGDEEYQILAGQWTPYLHYTMEDFQEGRREMPKKMKSKLKDLMAKEGDQGLAALFAFYASQQ